MSWLLQMHANINSWTKYELFKLYVAVKTKAMYLIYISFPKSSKQRKTLKEILA